MALVNESKSRFVNVRRVNSLYNEFSCRFTYSVDPHIPEICVGGKGRVWYCYLLGESRIDSG